MSVNPWELVREIADRQAAAAVTKDGPFPGSVVEVHDRFSQHTNVLAIVYHVLANDVMDNTMWYQGNTSRVVFTLTAASQQRGNTVRLANFLSEQVPYTDLSIPMAPIQLTRRPRHRLTGFKEGVQPEEQQLVVEIEEDTPNMAEETNLVQLLSCYHEGINTDFDSNLDLWKSECIFIATMANVYPNKEYIYAKAIA